MNLIERFHEKHRRKRRIDALCSHIVKLLPSGCLVLDVGCGDGLLADRIIKARPDVTVTGVDVLLRQQRFIPVRSFDGVSLPFKDDSFDVVMFIDVLHHTEDAEHLLREALRVSRKTFIIKDHLLEGAFAGPILTFMDRVGNARYNVCLECRYWPRKKWLETMASLGLIVEMWNESLDLFPWPANLLFERSLHFLASLKPKNTKAE